MDDRSIVFVNVKKDQNTAPKWTKVCIFAFPFDQCDQILCGRKFYPNMLCGCTWRYTWLVPVLVRDACPTPPCLVGQGRTFTLTPPRGLKAPPRASLVDTLYSPHPLQGANHKWSHHARGRTLVDFERHLGECFQRWRQRLILNDSSWCGYRNSDVHGEAAHQLLSWQVTFSQSTAATLT